jgi:sigma-B regulation protein RsbU (phosphoserine phosphatase)
MKLSLQSLSIKNKILIVLSTLPIAAISLIVVMATSIFEDDKLAYVYDTALSSTRAKASTVDSQLNSYIQSLKAINANFDPIVGKISNNGMSYFSSEADLKAFKSVEWDGKEFKENFSLSKDLRFSETEKNKLEILMQEAWYTGFTVGVSHDHPMHLYLIAKSNNEDFQGLSLLLIENANFFALFGEGEADQSLLFHSMRGHVAGDLKHNELPQYLENHVFNKKFHEGTKEAEFAKTIFLTSYSKVGKGHLYVVSLVDKQKALSAVRTLLRRSVVFTALILCFLIIIGVFASNTLTSALRGLADATSQVMDGDFTVRVEPKSQDEIGSLALSFNKMTEEVSRLMEKTAENARMEAELQTAHTVQDTLFPRNDAKIGPYCIYGDSVPASECGGDWWHYSEVNDKFYLWIGDATGHGVPAALLTSAARAVASVIEGIPDISPSQALSMLNKAIFSTSKGEMMMTFFLACFDLKNNKLTYCNASHDPPFLLSHEVQGKPKRRDYIPLMDVNNPRLGENAHSEYSDFTMDIHDGDRIVFYTDGIVDVKSPEGENWGERRFLKALRQITEQTVDLTVNGVFADLNEFRKETPLDDDVTLVVVEYEKQKAAA